MIVFRLRKNDARNPVLQRDGTGSFIGYNRPGNAVRIPSCHYTRWRDGMSLILFKKDEIVQSFLL